MRAFLALLTPAPQSVIVENKGGAGGSIATEYVAKAPADGYTVLFTVSSHSINQALIPTLPFDTERDLRGVTPESGFPGYESDTWIATFVPRAAPAEVVNRLHKATVTALSDPAVRSRMESQAGHIIGGSPAQLDTLVADEIRGFSRVVREQKLKPEMSITCHYQRSRP